MPLSASVPNGIVGMTNVGNTCYMNAVLQCLSHTTPLRNYLVRSTFPPNTRIAAYQTLLRALWKALETPSRRRGALNKVTMKEFQKGVQDALPQFTIYVQHDAQEFLVTLLDYWDDPQVSAMFKGQQLSRMVCGEATCAMHSTTQDPIECLCLPIPSSSHTRNGTNKRRETTLQACLDAYTQQESMPDWQCDTCERKSAHSTKQLQLLECPQVLVIQLKRFSYSEQGITTKIKTNVTFPLRDFQPIQGKDAASSPRYQLYAVCNHIGNTPNTGHYIAHVLSSDDQKWYKLDDDKS